MNILPDNVQKLINLLERLPGLGPKSSARIAMFLLKSPKGYTKELGGLINELYDKIVYCEECFNIASSSPCAICANPKRDHSLICVAEDPLDVLAFENGTDFIGVYHVLGGVISPLNGIGPEDLKVKELLNRISKGDVKELIIAMNPNIEGEATAMFIKEEISKIEKLKNVKVSRLALGLPSGADLEYTDKATLRKAFEGRIII